MRYQPFGKGTRVFSSYEEFVRQMHDAREKDPKDGLEKFAKYAGTDLKTLNEMRRSMVARVLKLGPRPQSVATRLRGRTQRKNVFARRRAPTRQSTR